MSSLNVNGKTVTVQSEPDTPLLWVLRCELGMTGTKFGCGVGVCGACTVHLDGKAQLSCQTLLRDVGAEKITTIEGLQGEEAKALKRILSECPAHGGLRTAQEQAAPLRNRY